MTRRDSVNFYAQSPAVLIRGNQPYLRFIALFHFLHRITGLFQ